MRGYNEVWGAAVRATTKAAKRHTTHQEAATQTEGPISLPPLRSNWWDQTKGRFVCPSANSLDRVMRNHTRCIWIFYTDFHISVFRIHKKRIANGRSELRRKEHIRVNMSKHFLAYYITFKSLNHMKMKSDVFILKTFFVLISLKGQ